MTSSAAARRDGTSSASIVVVIAAVLLGAMSIEAVRPDPVAAAASDHVFQSVEPARLVDTRPGRLTVDGDVEAVGRRGAGSTLAVPVAGRASVPTDAQAAIVNVTVVQPAASGHVTVFPCGVRRPLASSVNYAAGVAVANPNELIARIGADGAICVYTLAAAHLAVDVVGYVPADAPYTAATPRRLLDTRPGRATVDGEFAGAGPVRGGTQLRLDVTGRAGVPSSAVSAVMNVASVASTARGHVTVHPCRERPVASSVNYAPGQVRSNELIVELSAQGAVCLYVHATTHLVVDVVGWVESGSGYSETGPARLVDTRPGNATVDGEMSGFGAIDDGGVIPIWVSGRAGVPSSAVSVVVNVTTAGAGSPGYLTVFDCQQGNRPHASSLNYRPGAVNVNELVVGLNDLGEFCIYARRATDLVVDVVGYVDDATPADDVRPACGTPGAGAVFESDLTIDEYVDRVEARTIGEDEPLDSYRVPTADELSGLRDALGLLLDGDLDAAADAFAPFCYGVTVLANAGNPFVAFGELDFDANGVYERGWPGGLLPFDAAQRRPVVASSDRPLVLLTAPHTVHDWNTGLLSASMLQTLHLDPWFRSNYDIGYLYSTTYRHNSTAAGTQGGSLASDCSRTADHHCRHLAAEFVEHVDGQVVHLVPHGFSLDNWPAAEALDPPATGVIVGDENVTDYHAAFLGELLGEFPGSHGCWADWNDAIALCGNTDEIYRGQTGLAALHAEIETEWRTTNAWSDTADRIAAALVDALTTL